jgi:hypothetical protein
MWFKYLHDGAVPDTLTNLLDAAAGENGEWIHFDYVPGESEVRTGSSDVTGKIVVIGSEVKKDAVKALFGI